MDTRFCNRIGSVGRSRLNNCPISPNAGPPLSSRVPTALSCACSSPVTVARFAAHAWMAPEVLFCESSTGLT
ncbi:Uncharacterised protein [Mycobacteroides abscessus subsp. abscessus]|nr:Uncharacterised protein [Mycobacteroides abscessus subsp. abscessus]